MWTYDTPSYINGVPAASGNIVAFGGCDGNLHVVSITDGSALRKIETGTYIAASPALDGNIAYVGNYGGLFVKADVATGLVLWEYGDGKTAYFSSPCVGKGAVLFGGRDDYLHCLESGNGTVRWSFHSGADVDGSPAVCGNKVVFAGNDGKIYLLDIRTGRKLWSRSIGSAVASSPAVAVPFVVVGSDDGYLYAFKNLEGGGV
jgi:outer membrane protein assembly factor BamB